MKNTIVKIIFLFQFLYFIFPVWSEFSQLHAQELQNEDGQFMQADTLWWFKQHSDFELPQNFECS